MPIIDCTVPSCTGKVNTTLACKEVSALFGIRAMLDTSHALAINDTAKEQTRQYLDYINKKIGEFKIEEVPGQPTISSLYIECTNGHRAYYNVECK